jgi:hypothetical protein
MSAGDTANSGNGTFTQGDLADVPGFVPPEALLVPADGAETLPSLPRVDRPPAGRDRETGRFTLGNHLGRGSPLAGKAAKLRAELFATTTRQRMRNLVDALLTKAEAGDTAAAKLILQYTLGEPQSIDLIETVAKLEAVILKGVST